MPGHQPVDCGLDPKKCRYRPEFWRDNAVIKDIPFEERVTKDFEGKKVFGNLN